MTQPVVAGWKQGAAVPRCTRNSFRPGCATRAEKQNAKMVMINVTMVKRRRTINIGFPETH